MLILFDTESHGTSSSTFEIDPRLIIVLIMEILATLKKEEKNKKRENK